jgi:hypothetical protein
MAGSDTIRRPLDRAKTLPFASPNVCLALADQRTRARLPGASPLRRRNHR